MSELAIPESLLDFRTGELIPAADVPRVVDALAEMRLMQRRLREGINTAQAILIAESERQGTKTLHVKGATLEISGGQELVWDIEELAKLIDLGLPQERYDDLVKTVTEYKVDARVAKQLEGANPDYAKVIAQARSYVQKNRYVKVKGGSS